MRLLRSRFIRIAVLPNFVFTLGLILQAASSWKVAENAVQASIIFEETGAILTFGVIRNLLLVGYLIAMVYLFYQYLNSKKKDVKVFVRSFIIVCVGIILSQFSLFFALLAYNIVSRIIT